MPLVELNVKVGNEKYAIKRELVSDSPAKYKIQVLDSKKVVRLEIGVISDWAHGFVENDKYVENIIKELIKSNDCKK